MSTVEDPKGSDISFTKLSFNQVVLTLSNRLQREKHLPLTDYLVEGPISKEELHAAVALPFELFFSEHNGKVIISHYEGFISYGDYDRVQAYRKRFQGSRLNCHTHTHGLEVLSLQDIDVFTKLSDQTQILLVHSLGISRFQKPIYDLQGNLLNADGSTASEEQYSRLVKEFQLDKGISFDEVRREQNLSIQEQNRLSREFVSRTGMHVETASWNSRRIQRLADIINCREPEDYEPSVPERIRKGLAKGLQYATRRCHTIRQVEK